jgi:serralysin
MATYYVATTGNDANNGTSPALAKQHVSAGLGLLAGGDTLIIGAGTYNDGINDNVPSGANWGAPTRIQAAAGTTVWLAPTSGAFVIFFDQTVQFIEFTGINLDATRGITTGCVYLRGWTGGNPNHIRFQNAEVIGPQNGVINEGGAAYAGFQITGEIAGLTGSNEFLNLTVHGCGDAGDFSPAFYIATSDNLISNNNMYDLGGTGVLVFNTLTTNNNIVRNNFVHDISRTATDFIVGIYVGPGTNSQVYNNVIYNLTGLNDGTNAGIAVASGSSSNPLLYQNTITGCTTMAGIHIFAGTGGAIVENNIVYANTPNNLVDDVGSTLTTNLVGVNPVFVSPSTFNYQLTIGSPAIDAGTTNAYTTDILGVTRPQGSAFDIGAYEFVVGPAPNDLWAASVM